MSADDDCLSRWNLESFHYNTVKLVTIKDARVTCCYWSLIIATFVLGIYNILKSHSYCDLEELDDRHYHSEFFWRSLKWQRTYDKARDQPPPPYCTGEIDMDFWFAPHRKYIDNECVWWYERGDVTGKSSGNELRATTSYGMWNGSSVDHAQITPFVEHFNLISHFTVAIRDIEEVPETWIKKNDTWELLFHRNPEGSQSFLQLYVQDLLDLSGVSLDDRNEGVAGTDGMIRAPRSFENKWPTYRLTGLQFNLIYDVSNTKFSKHLFDRTTRNRIEVEVGTLNSSTTWVCSGFRYLKMEDGRMVNAHSCDIRVKILVGGTFCFFSWNKLMGSCIDVVVLFSVAAFLVDQIFMTVLHNTHFRKAKITKGENQRLLEDAAENREDQLPLLRNNMLEDPEEP